MRSTRFKCPSYSLVPKALLRKRKAVVGSCAAVAVAAHVALTGIGGLEPEQKAAKPLSTQFVKRQPRLTKPLELKKRPKPRRRIVQREMVSVKAKVQRAMGEVRFEGMDVFRRLARPGVDIARIARVQPAQLEPSSLAEAVEGTRQAEQKIDMSLELLDISALNTGRYHAMVVQDPTDKKNLRGFCRLSCLYIPRLHDRALEHMGGRGTTWFNHYVAGCVRNLAEAVNHYTGINAYIGERVTIDNPEMFSMPWVFHVYFYQGYRLSDSELETLGRYLLTGGLIFADAHPFEQFSVATSHTKNLLAALQAHGVRSSFDILPNSHPIYHCYFDFSMPPPGGDAMLGRYEEYPSERTIYLEGLHVGGRLVAVLSKKGYYSCWCEWGPYAGRTGYPDLDPTRQIQFGVNVIVLALTQEGSITHRLMDTVKY